MTDATYENPHQPLGVGRLFGDTYSIFFRKLPVILLLGFVPSLAQFIIEGGWATQTANEISFGNQVDFTDLASILGFVVTMVIGSIVTASIVQLSYDAKLNQPIRLGLYLSAAIRNVPAIVVLSLVAMLLYILGFALLIVPGLWVYAVFSVFVPAIVIEGAGFGALGRSAALTKGYRWPIVGAMVLVFIVMFVGIILLLSLTTMVSGVVLSMAPGAGVIVLAIMSAVLFGGVGYGIAGVLVALIFARLKEIKEGVTVADLVDVFK